ncbi:TPA: ribonuclease HII [Candidatus Wolfebacteria bacterium]|nr:ribonuclease HII [Candidatus Wolfebacteria bacterium]
MLSIMTRPKNKSYIISIDEVGRGPLAGPVVVCAVAIPYSCTPTSILKHLPLRDSKKLTPTARALWATAIAHDSRIFHSIASTSPSTIDRINITQATNRAATRALTKLLATLPSPSRVAVFLDGGLFVNPQNSKFEIRNLKSNTKQKYRSRFHNSKADTHIDLKIETVIKGDETIPAISLASIVAKEHRDTRMRRAHKKYPYYGFDRHVGYGTKMHLAAIRENGHSPLHRKSFLKKIY